MLRSNNRLSVIYSGSLAQPAGNGGLTWLHLQFILGLQRLGCDVLFLDIDPGFGQMWRELGWHDPFQGHNNFVTLGRNIGRNDCAIPDCGLNWITMAQPIVLDHWPAQPLNPAAPITGIGAWRGPNAPIEYRGHTYGLRVH